MSVKTFSPATYQRLDEDASFVKRRIENFLLSIVVDCNRKLPHSVKSVDYVAGWRRVCYVTFQDDLKLSFQNWHKTNKYDRDDNCRIGIAETSSISRGLAIKDILINPDKEYSIKVLRSQFDELCETIRKRMSEYKKLREHKDEIQKLMQLGRDLYKDEDVCVAVNVRNTNRSNEHRIDFNIRVFAKDIADVYIDEDGKNFEIAIHTISPPYYDNFKNLEQTEKFIKKATQTYEIAIKKIKEIADFIEKIKEDMQIIYRSYNPEKETDKN